MESSRRINRGTWGNRKRASGRCDSHVCGLSGRVGRVRWGAVTLSLSVLYGAGIGHNSYCKSPVPRGPTWDTVSQFFSFVVCGCFGGPWLEQLLDWYCSVYGHWSLSVVILHFYLMKLIKNLCK